MRKKGLCREECFGTGEGGGECYGKAIGKVNPSTLGKTTSLS